MATIAVGKVGKLVLSRTFYSSSFRARGQISRPCKTFEKNCSNKLI
jgi:hypothetical protein